MSRPDAKHDGRFYDHCALTHPDDQRPSVVRIPRLSAHSVSGLHGATLVIAKLDRLSRDAAFLLNL